MCNSDLQPKPLEHYKRTLNILTFVKMKFQIRENGIIGKVRSRQYFVLTALVLTSFITLCLKSDI